MKTAMPGAPTQQTRQIKKSLPGKIIADFCSLWLESKFDRAIEKNNDI